MPSNKTVPNRWADPDNSSGVSGPPNEETETHTQPILNNNKNPLGGPATCTWPTDSCGPNDEPFSTPVGGLVAAGLADGSVRFFSDTLDAQTVRQLCRSPRRRGHLVARLTMDTSQMAAGTIPAGGHPGLPGLRLHRHRILPSHRWRWTRATAGGRRPRLP